MQVIDTLYGQNPVWIWLAAAALFVALDIATGFGRLIWLAAAAAVVAALELMRLRLGLVVEGVVFLAFSAAGLALSLPRRPRTPRPVFDNDIVPPLKVPLHPAGIGGQDRTARLVGRIGRTSSEFINGVGRVWIDGAEWAAEIEGWDEAAPPDFPVRVTGVAGGVRLRVRSLTEA